MHNSNHTTRSYKLANQTSTRRLGAAIAHAVGLHTAADIPEQLRPAAVIYLEGEIGAGKTTLVAGLIHNLNPAAIVKSPTYTLVELHVVSALNLYHFDFYKLAYPEELIEAGLDEYFQKDGVCLVEWPARASSFLPNADLLIQLEWSKNSIANDSNETDVREARETTISAHSHRGEQWLSRLALFPGEIS